MHFLWNSKNLDSIIWFCCLFQNLGQHNLKTSNDILSLQRTIIEQLEIRSSGYMQQCPWNSAKSYEWLFQSKFEHLSSSTQFVYRIISIISITNGKRAITVNDFHGNATNMFINHSLKWSIWISEWQFNIFMRIKNP